MNVLPICRLLGRQKSLLLLFEELDLSAMAMPTTHIITKVDPKTHNLLGICCITIIWQRYAKMISKALKTDTEVGDTILNATVMEKYPKMPTIEIMERVNQSVTDKDAKWLKNPNASVLIKSPMTETMTPLIPE